MSQAFYTEPECYIFSNLDYCFVIIFFKILNLTNYLFFVFCVHVCKQKFYSVAMISRNQLKERTACSNAASVICVDRRKVRTPYAHCITYYGADLFVYQCLLEPRIARTMNEQKEIHNKFTVNSTFSVCSKHILNRRDELSSIYRSDVEY